MDEHHAVLYRFARQLLADSESAAALTRTAFLRWLREPSEFGPPEAVRPGLLRAVHREFLSRQQLLPASSSIAKSAPDLIARTEIPLRASLTLYYLENLSMAEIADILELSPEEVRRRIDVGKARLREIMAETTPIETPDPATPANNAIV